MPNTFRTPQEVAREAIVLTSENMVMGGLVYRGLERNAMARKAGSTVRVPKPATFVARDLTADLAGSGMVAQVATEGELEVNLTTHKYVQIAVTSAEMSMSIQDLSEQILRPAVLPLASAVDAALCGCYNEIPYVSGTAGTTPSDLDDLAAVHKVLMDNHVPVDPQNLHTVMNTSAQAKLLPLFSNLGAAKPTAGNLALEAAGIGQVFNMNTWMDQNIVTHTPGAPGGSPTASGTAGALQVTIASGGSGGTFAKGDIISIATLTQTFVVTEALTLGTGGSSGAGTLKIYPALPSTISTQAVTVAAAHAANLAFHKNGLCLATAPLAAPMGGARGETVTYNGLTMRVVYDWANQADVITLDILFGVKVINPELCAVLYG